MGVYVNAVVHPTVGGTIEDSTSQIQIVFLRYHHAFASHFRYRSNIIVLNVDNGRTFNGHGD
jgi:hypothetical protein